MTELGEYSRSRVAASSGSGMVGSGISAASTLSPPTGRQERSDIGVTPTLSYPVGRGHDPADLLRERGIQVTAQRLAVLRAVSGQPHITADGVAEVVRAEIGAISLQSVYDALGVLVAAGLLRRIQPAGSPARFEDRVGDNHHHLICRVCGRLVDVDCAVGAAPCLTAADDQGYEIDEAEVAYWGRCPDVPGAGARHAASPNHPHPRRGRPRLARTPDSRGQRHMANESKCPFSGNAHSGTSNRDWWPNQLNLKVLHQHPPTGDPMGDGLRLRRGVQDRSTSTR